MQRLRDKLLQADAGSCSLRSVPGRLAAIQVARSIWEHATLPWGPQSPQRSSPERLVAIESVAGTHDQTHRRRNDLRSKASSRLYGRGARASPRTGFVWPRIRLLSLAPFKEPWLSHTYSHSRRA